MVGVLNSLTLLLSLPVIGAALWLSLRAAALLECGRFLHLPLLAVGAALFVTSLLGLVGSFFRVSGFLWAYLAVLTLVIVAVLAFAVVALVVTNRGVGRALLGKDYEEYHLGHYSHWFQRRVHEWKNWKVIASCLRDGKVCRRGGSFAGIMAGLFFRQNLRPIQVRLLRSFFQKKEQNLVEEDQSSDYNSHQEDFLMIFTFAVWLLQAPEVLQIQEHERNMDDP